MISVAQNRSQFLILCASLLLCSCSVQDRQNQDPVASLGSQTPVTPPGIGAKGRDAYSSTAPVTAPTPDPDHSGDPVPTSRDGRFATSPSAPTAATAMDVLDTFYFGRHSEHGTVTLEQWDDFLRAEVIPRFPQGLITWQGSSQRRNEKNLIDVEPTFMLQLIHPSSPAAEQAIDAIASAYKQHFIQTSLLLVHQIAVVSH